MQWAGRLGSSVALVAQEIFADQAVDGMPRVRALIRLADTYTTKRLQAACRRAMHFATPSYRSAKNIPVHETGPSATATTVTAPGRTDPVPVRTASTATSTPTTPRRRVEHQ